jgi:hypothetical protein
MVMKATQGEFQETTDGEYTLTLTGVKADSEAAITINDPQVSGDTVTFTATPHRNPLESQGGPPQLLYLQVETRLIVGL